jgi:hypothetical protein
MADFMKIVLLGVLSAILYGIVHDQVTVRVCLEYFTVFHRPVFDTNSPTLLALGWGVIATWWVGLGLGVPVAMFARIGRRPKLSVRQLLGPLALLMAMMGVLSLAAGISGYLSARSGVVALWEPIASKVPQDRHCAFLADFWAHRAAYGTAIFGSILLWGWCVYKRNTLAIASRSETQPRPSP